MKIHSTAGWSALAMSLAAAMPSAAQAQDSAPPSAAVATSSSDIVVTARRREERLQDVPVAVTALGGDSLQKANIVQVQEIAQKVPGLTIQPSSFGSNVLVLSIRGQRQFDPYLTKDQAVAVYFADVIQNRAQGLNSALFDLQSVQVLKGPQGTLFGRNTTGGAMLITPKAPTSDFEGYIMGGIGSYATRKLEGALNFPIGDWAALRVAGALQRRDGYTNNVTTGQKLDDEHKDNWRVSLKVTPFDGFENRLVVNGFKADENGIGYKLTGLIPTIGFGSAPALVNELARTNALPFWSTTSDMVLHTQIKTFTLSNTTQYQISDGVTVKNIFGYRKVDSVIPFDFDGSAATFTDGRGVVIGYAPSRETMHVSQWSDELQLLGTVFDGSLDYILGGYYFLERGDDQQNSGGKFGVSRTVNGVAGVYTGERATYANPVRNLSYSGFAQFTWRLPFLPGVSLTAGGRETHDARGITTRNYISGGGIDDGVCRLSGFDAAVQAACSYSAEATFNRFTYTLSADWKITRDVLVYIAHRKGYRAGGFNISALTPGTLTPFQPEDVKDVEVGLKTKFAMAGGSGTFNVAAYTQDYKNIQRTSGGTVVINGVNQFVQSIFNVASARIKGFEADLSLQPAPWLDAGMSVSNIDAKFTNWLQPNGSGGFIDLSSSVIVGTPKWTMSAYAGVNIPVGSSEVGLRMDVFHQTKTQMVDNNFVPALNAISPIGNVPGYTVANARIDLRRIAGKDITLSGWVKNLFNEKYYLGGTDLAGSGLGWAASFMGAPRMFGVEARFGF